MLKFAGYFHFKDLATLGGRLLVSKHLFALLPAFVVGKHFDTLCVAKIHNEAATISKRKINFIVTSFMIEKDFNFVRKQDLVLSKQNPRWENAISRNLNRQERYKSLGNPFKNKKNTRTFHKSKY